MAVSAGQVFVDLGARLDRREFDAYEKQLRKVQERTAKREHFKAELGANFDSRAFNAYERELRKAERANDDMVRSNGRLRTSFGSIWSRGGAAFAAAGGAFAVVTAVKSVTKAYGESQVSQEKMAAQLKALGISYDAHAKQIDQVIQKTSQLAGLDDEDLQDAFTNIVRVTGNVDKSLRLVGLAADFARAKHMDVAKAGELVGKVAGGNTGILSRYGIQIDKGASATEALGLLQRKFSGQAEAYGKTQAGSMDRVKVAFENLQEIIGKRLGPTLTRAANGLANFINQMGTGEGAGGKFVDVLQTIGRGFTLFARGVRTTTNVIAGFFSGIFRAMQALGEAGSHLPGVGDRFRSFARDADRAADRIDAFRKKLKISVEAGQVRDDLERMRKKTGSSLSDIRDFVDDGVKLINRRLGNTKQGTDALARHYEDAVRAIRSAMRRGRISTATGLAEIQRLMLDELKTLGIASAQKSGKPLTQDPAAANRAQRDMGGWLGGRGLIGHDTIPAMLAPGEAVLNRHQQAVIEGMLGEGFLDRLFAQVNRPHFMQRGGRIRFAAGGRFNAAGIGRLWTQEGGPQDQAQIAGAVGMAESGGNPHAVGPPTPSGRAIGLMQILGAVLPGNLFDPAVNMRNAISKYRSAHGWSPWEAFTNGNYRRFLSGADATPHAAGPDLIARVWKAIKSPQTTMGGLLGDIVQGTLDRTTSLANRRGRALAAAAGPQVSGGGGALPAGASPNLQAAEALARRMGLSITSTTGGGHVKGSYHYQGRAFDASDGVNTPNEHAFFKAVASRWGRNITELFFDPEGAIKNGQRIPAIGGHSDHVHVAFNKGGVARYAKGGRAGVGGERAWLNRSWAQVAPLFGLPADSKLGSLFKHIRLSKDNLFVGVSSDLGAKGHETDELLWPRWLWQGSKNQRALDDRSKLQLFIHEMAHRFQSHEATPSEWESEGGAEAFARIAMDRQFGGRRSSKGDPYNAFVTRVVKRRGMDWIARAQFGKAMGGFVNFAKGGRAGSKLAKTVGGASAGLIRKVRPLQTDRSQQFDALMTRVESADQNYSRWERRFNITDEELVDSDTGAVNVAAVQRKAKELGQLIFIRAGMERDLEMARDVAKRIVASYRKVVTALRNSLRHSKKKNRKGIQSYINQYQPRITEWQGKVAEVGGSLFDATTDKLELRAELRDVLGTAPELRDTATDTATDTGGADTGVDTTGPDATVDTTTAPPTPLQIAEGVAAEMRTFLSGRQELLQSFGRNYLTPGGAGAYFSGRDALDASAGARFFGGSAGGGPLGGLSGGSTVIAHFASAPDNAPTFVQQMRFLVESGSSG